MGYFRILAVIPGFFLSALFLMLLWRAISPQFGIATISYVKAMLVTITLWIVVAPLAAAGRGHRSILGSSTRPNPAIQEAGH